MSTIIYSEGIQMEIFYDCLPCILRQAVELSEMITDDIKKKNYIIKEALKNCSKVKSVTGLGLMLGIECNNAKDIMNECLKKGLVVLTAKEKVRLLPALNISNEELNTGLEILVEVLK